MCAVSAWDKTRRDVHSHIAKCNINSHTLTHTDRLSEIHKTEWKCCNSLTDHVIGDMNLDLPFCFKRHLAFNTLVCFLLQDQRKQKIWKTLSFMWTNKNLFCYIKLCSAEYKHFQKVWTVLKMVMKTRCKIICFLKTVLQSFSVFFIVLFGKMVHPCLWKNELFNQDTITCL